MSDTSHTIHIVTIGGSVRPGNFTAKALAVVNDELSGMSEVVLDVVDPADLTLPLPGRDGGSEEMEDLRHRVSRATGIVLATPEYHGGVSSVLKLVIDNLGFPSMLQGKPVALLGVASGVIGAVKALEQLRSICSHVGAIVLPGPVSVASVHTVFDEQGNCTDEKIEARLRGSAWALVGWIEDHICPRMALERMVREGDE